MYLDKDSIIIRAFKCMLIYYGAPAYQLRYIYISDIPACSYKSIFTELYVNVLLDYIIGAVPTCTQK